MMIIGRLHQSSEHLSHKNINKPWAKSALPSAHLLCSYRPVRSNQLQPPDSNTTLAGVLDACYSEVSKVENIEQTTLGVPGSGRFFLAPRSAHFSDYLLVRGTHAVA